jgi:hypothetical protein
MQHHMSAHQIVTNTNPASKMQSSKSEERHLKSQQNQR